MFTNHLCLEQHSRNPLTKVFLFCKFGFSRQRFSVYPWLSLNSGIHLPLLMGLKGEPPLLDKQEFLEGLLLPCTFLSSPERLAILSPQSLCSNGALG